MSLNSIQDVIKKHPIATWSSSQLQMLLASYLVFRFILPPIETQGNQRQEDMDIALIGMLSLLIVNGSSELNAIMRILKPRITNRTHGLNTEKLQKRFYLGLRYLRSAGIEIGITLDFFRVLNQIVSDDPASNNFLSQLAAWLFQQSSWTRFGIAAPLILGKSAFNYFVASKEISTLVPGRDNTRANLLLFNLPQFNQRKFNNWSRLRLATELPMQFMFLSVLSALALEIYLGFTDKQWPRQDMMGLMFGLGSVFTVMKIFPDHPHFAYISPLNKIARFIDKFVKTGLINTISIFMITMDLISYFDKKQDITLNNNTALVSLTMFATISTYLSEVLYKMATLANEKNPRVEESMGSSDFFTKMSSSLYWWLASGNGNPWVSIPAGILGVISFDVPDKSCAAITSRSYGHINPTALKEKFINIANQINFSLFLSSALLQLTPGKHLSMPAKLGITAAGALPLTLLHHFADQDNGYSFRGKDALMYGLEFFTQTLIVGAFYQGIKALITPFGVDLPNQASYGVMAIPSVLLALQLVINLCGKETLGDAATNSLNKLAHTKLLSRALTFFIATSMLFSEAEGLNSSSNTSTGVVPMLTALGVTTLMTYRGLEQGKGTVFGIKSSFFKCLRNSDLDSTLPVNRPPSEGTFLLEQEHTFHG